jgi:type VI secretion system Hcp family effector
MTASSAGGATSGRVDFSPVTISKPIDKASPKLWDACNTGRHIKEIVQAPYGGLSEINPEYLKQIGV